MKKILLVFFYFLLSFNTLIAQETKKETQIDHMALATLMVYDGKYDVARDELKLVDKNAPLFDAAKFYTISGVINSKENKYLDAIESYKKAITATQNKVFKAPVIEKKEKYLFSLASEKKKETTTLNQYDPKKVKKEKLEQLYIYLSQAYYKVKDYKNTVESLDLAGDKGRDRAALYSLRAECYWKIKEHSHAIEALSKGMALFPQEHTLLKQKFYYLAQLNLFQAAVANAKEYIRLSGDSSAEHIALAQLLLGANQNEEAIKVLEEAKLKFPKESKIGVILAHAYLKKDMKHTAADIYESSSIYDKKYVSDAVEMHRRAKSLPHAIYLNSQMSDKVQKLKNKIAIYIDRGEFEKVIGLIDGLKRYNLLEDDNVRYALAYSYYMSKDYDNAEKELKKISDSELFAKATVIRKNIEKCRNDSMECI